MTLTEQLDLLESRRLLRLIAGEPEIEYLFSHALVQEAVYGSMLFADRRVCHRMVGETLEQLYREQLDEWASILAYHFQLAQDYEKAIRYFGRAADYASARYANAEAIGLYRAALELATQRLEALPLETMDEMIAQLNERLGGRLMLTGFIDEARAAFQEALHQLPALDKTGHLRLETKIAYTWEAQHNYKKALETHDRAEALLGSVPTKPDLAWWQAWLDIQMARVQIYYWLNEVDEMSALAERMGPNLEQYGTSSQRGAYFDKLNMLGLRLERYAISSKTLGYARAALVATEEGGEPGELAWAQFTLGFNYLWYGDLDQAVAQMQSALTIAEQTGDIACQSSCLTYLGVTFRKGGDVAPTEIYSHEGLARAANAQQPHYVAINKANLAWVAWRNGNLSEAQTLSDKAFEELSPTPHGEVLLWLVLWPLIGLGLKQNRLAEAIEQARALLGPTQQPQPEALAHGLQEAIEAWDRGERDAAQTYLTQVADKAMAQGYL